MNKLREQFEKETGVKTVDNETLKKLFSLKYPTRQDMRIMISTQKSIITDTNKSVSDLIEKYKDEYCQLIKGTSKIHLGMADAVKIIVKDLQSIIKEK